MSDYDPRTYWSGVAEELDRREGSNRLMAGDDTPFYRYKRRTFVDQMLGSMDVAGRSVVEVGCGAGANLIELGRRGPSRLVGCDISPRMLELAGRRVDVPLVEVGGKTLPFEDREFDLVFSVTVLHHNLDDAMEPLLAEMCRVAGRELFLFEHTAPERGESLAYVERPVEHYVRVCEANGFSLTRSQMLRVGVSERASSAARRRLARGRPEGAPTRRGEEMVERALLPLTRLLDRASSPSRGLTMMAFRRSDQEASLL